MLFYIFVTDIKGIMRNLILSLCIVLMPKFYFATPNTAHICNGSNLTLHLLSSENESNSCDQHKKDSHPCEDKDDCHHSGPCQCIKSTSTGFFSILVETEEIEITLHIKPYKEKWFNISDNLISNDFHFIWKPPRFV